MSIERCESCCRPIDTDFDSECYVEVGNMRRMTWTIALCEPCRDLKLVEEERTASQQAWWESMAEEAEHEHRP